MARVSRVFRWLIDELRTRWDTTVNLARLGSLTRQVAALAENHPGPHRTAVVFNASTRLGNVSLNAAYSLLTAWALRLAGWRVVHFVCEAGMSRCLLGSSENDPNQLPPCQNCVATSQALYASAEVAGFSFQRNEALEGALVELSTTELAAFHYDGLPLGELVLPSVRWRMRRHHLDEDFATLLLFREFILSAYQVAIDFRNLIEREDPDLVLVFNGQMFPEAVVAHVARQRGIQTITHETGYQPYTVFMTTGDATSPRACKIPRNGSERSEPRSALHAVASRPTRQPTAEKPPRRARQGRWAGIPPHGSSDPE